MKKLELHWRILIGMLLGLLFGFGMTYVDGGREMVSDWINPFGTIFIKLLKLIAIPLILASLIKGISDLKDISKFRNIGLRTMGIYMGTTIVAIILGLVLVNVYSQEMEFLTRRSLNLPLPMPVIAVLFQNWRRQHVKRKAASKISGGYGAR